MLAIGNLLGGPIIFLDRPGPTQTYPCLRHCLKCNSRVSYLLDILKDHAMIMSS